MIRSIRKHTRRDEGASAVEYGLLVAGIAVVIILAVFFLGGTIRNMFQKTGSCIAASGVGC